MVTQEQLVDGIYRYIKNEMLPSMPNYAKFLAGAVLVRNVGRMGEFLTNISNGKLMRTVGVIEPDGCIDIDLWANDLKHSMNEFCGGKAEIELPMLPTLIFRENDIDTLRRYIKGELI